MSVTHHEDTVVGWEFVEVNQPLVRVEKPRPHPDSHQVIVRTTSSGVCHSDTGYIDGTLTALLGRVPIILGHEIAGVIIEIGTDVDGWTVGDRVAVNANVDGPGGGYDGGFASHVVVDDDDLVLIPDGLAFDQAATATDAGRTAYHAVRSIGRVEAKDRVGIIGFGGLGSLGASIAVALGAEVYVAETNETLWPRATRAGVTKVSRSITDFTPDGLDVIIDFAGFGDTTAGAVAAVRRGGRVVQVGLGQQEAHFNVLDLVLKEVRLLGSVVGTNQDIAEVMDLMVAGKVASKIVTTDFDHIPESLELLRRGAVDGRMVIAFDE